MLSMKLSDALRLMASKETVGKWEKQVCLDAAQHMERMETNISTLWAENTAGRLLRLPVKRGDTVYVIERLHSHLFKVRRREVLAVGTPPRTLTGLRRDEIGFKVDAMPHWRPFADVGRNVFLSKDEARVEVERRQR